MEKDITELQAQLQQGAINRRAFIRRATALGLSLAVAEVLAACAPSGALTPEPTPVFTESIDDVQGVNPTATPKPENQFQAFIPDTDNVIPTPDPTPTKPAAYPTSTPVRLWRTATPEPIWAAEASWACPGCEERFVRQDDMLKHFADNHARKMPGVRQVSEPTYAQFLRGVERFDQKNIVFMRVVWDEEYQKLMPHVTPWRRQETEAEAQEGSARMLGAIYTDDKAGSFHPAYYGYFGHLQGIDGMYSWDEPVNPNKYPVTNAAKVSQQVKMMARFYGADLVGICEIKPTWVYSHYFDRETEAYGPLEIPYKYAVVMAIEMKWEEGIVESPGFPSSAATALAYSNMAEVSSKMAQYIRMLGYEAVPSGNDTTQSIPLAIDAGLGELGRNGLLVTPEFGPRVRVCKVYTNLPLQPDQPVDFGLQGFCEKCRFCASTCPIEAIPFGDRALTQTSISNRPGILRWAVDVGKCYLFWVSNLAKGAARWNDCANCVRSCPWSAPIRKWL